MKNFPYPVYEEFPRWEIPQHEAEGVWASKNERDESYAIVTMMFLGIPEEVDNTVDCGYPYETS